MIGSGGQSVKTPGRFCWSCGSGIMVGALAKPTDARHNKTKTTARCFTSDFQDGFFLRHSSSEINTYPCSHWFARLRLERNVSTCGSLPLGPKKVGLSHFCLCVLAHPIAEFVDIG